MFLHNTITPGSFKTKSAEGSTTNGNVHRTSIRKVYKYETWDYFDIVYAQSYARLCSYLIGFLLAQYVYKRRTNKTENDSTVILTCGWIITLVMLNIVIFALYDKEVSAWDSAFYIAVKDIFYSCGFAWIVYVCVTGQAGFLNRIFSWKYLVPFSRLCFCAYLIHLALLIRYYYQAEKPETPSLSPLIHQIVHILTSTFALSFLTSLLFETPVSRLFALYMESKIKSLKKE
ncbi:uncharacterized protein NPIL_271341 [Nephila pilipes]|uniref:Nose resistant to fluoxetine protein 6 n=1 Tax=Nephila pilipes TaxID=299642 RepID=A0A8X6U2E7_NEPPI|nr:uncharacterized protein NPIL_271341 [Nephila pilipes]